MDQFYYIVVIIALIILVVALIGLGVLLQKQDDGEVFPPVQNQCPDGWTKGADGTCTFKGNNTNLGSFKPNALNAKDFAYLERTTGVQYTQKSGSTTEPTSPGSAVTYYSSDFPTRSDVLENDLGTGTFDPAASGDQTLPTAGSSSVTYTLKFKSAATACDKKKWANMHGIIWDGISNYNQCT